MPIYEGLLGVLGLGGCPDRGDSNLPHDETSPEEPVLRPEGDDLVLRQAFAIMWSVQANGRTLNFLEALWFECLPAACPVLLNTEGKNSTKIHRCYCIQGCPTWVLR